MNDSSEVQCLLREALPFCRDKSIAALVPLFAAKRTVKGQVLLRQGERFSQVFLVSQGCLRLYFVRRDGREFNKNFYTDGLVWPVTRAMRDEPSLFAIASVETGLLYDADCDEFRKVLKTHDEWQATQRQVLAYMVTQKLRREHDLLALDGRQRYEQFTARHPQLAERIPLSQMATYLGVTDVSLSRIRRAIKARRAD